MALSKQDKEFITAVINMRNKENDEFRIKTECLIYGENGLLERTKDSEEKINSIGLVLQEMKEGVKWNKRLTGVLVTAIFGMVSLMFYINFHNTQ